MKNGTILNAAIDESDFRDDTTVINSIETLILDERVIAGSQVRGTITSSQPSKPLSPVSFSSSLSSMNINTNTSIPSCIYPQPSPKSSEADSEKSEISINNIHINVNNINASAHNANRKNDNSKVKIVTNEDLSATIYTTPAENEIVQINNKEIDAKNVEAIKREQEILENKQIDEIISSLESICYEHSLNILEFSIQVPQFPPNNMNIKCYNELREKYKFILMQFKDDLSMLTSNYKHEIDKVILDLRSKKY